MLPAIKTIPTKIKYLIIGISVLTFLCLNFGVGFIIHTTISGAIENVFGLFLSFSSGTIDYLVLSSTPIVGMVYHSKRKQFSLDQLIKDELLTFGCVGISFLLSLFVIALTGKTSNALIPEYLRIEPFFLFSTLMLVAGMFSPFVLFKKRVELSNNHRV